MELANEERPKIWCRKKENFIKYFEMDFGITIKMNKKIEWVLYLG